MISLLTAALPAPGALAGFQDEVRKTLEAQNGQGAAVAVVGENGPRYVKGTGMADRHGEMQATQTTLFPIASVSKIFIGLALTDLQVQGKLDLWTPIKQIIPDSPARNPWRKTHPVRVIHLLEHTSGFQEIIVPWYEPRLHDYPPLETVLQTQVEPVTASFRPGSVVTYSNFNYMLAAYVIEKVTGQKFDNYIRERIFEPLGMHASTFRLEEAKKHPLAMGYKAADPPVPIQPVENLYRYSAGMFSSAEELSHFLQMLLQNGRWKGEQIFPKDAIALMEKPQTPPTAKYDAVLGHGPGVVVRQTNHRLLMGHRGAIDGFLSSLYYNRAEGFAYAILFNAHILPKTPSRSRLEDEIFRRFFPKTRQAAPPVAHVDPAVLEEKEGFYRFVNPRFPVTGFLGRLGSNMWIRATDDGLVKETLRDDPVALKPLSPHRYRKGHEVQASLVFGTMDGVGPYAAKVSNDFYVKSSPVPRMTLLLFVASALGFMATIPIYLVAKLVVPKLRRGNHSLSKATDGLLGLAVLSLLGVVAVVSFVDMTKEATTMGPLTLSLWALTWIFALTSFAGFAGGTVEVLTMKGTAARVYRFAAGVACVYFTLYLAAHGVIGIRFWDLA